MDRIIPKKKWTKLRLSLIALVLLFASLIIYVISKQSEGKKLKIDTVGLQIDTVKLDVFHEYIATSATVIPFKTVYLEAVEGGRVEETFVEEGSTVVCGQPILRLSNPQLLLDVMNREAEYSQQLNNSEALKLQASNTELNLQNSLLELELDLKNQQRDFDNKQRLFTAGMLAKNDLDNSADRLEYLKKKQQLLLKSFISTTDGALLQQNQIKNAIDNLKNNLSVIKSLAGNLLVKATADGELSGLNLEIGQYKGKGERLGVINQTDKFKLQTSVDQFYLSRISAGTNAETVYNDKKITLKVRKVFPEVKNNAIKVELEFTDSLATGLRNGQSLDIRFYISNPTKSLQIAKGNFFQGSGGNWVFVVDKDGKTARKRNVKLGRSNPLAFEITEGLSAGEKIITSDYESFSDADVLVISNN